jgi:hypothetical protein
MESRALGRTDNRDCLGAWYDILKVCCIHWTLDAGCASALGNALVAGR